MKSTTFRQMVKQVLSGQAERQMEIRVRNWLAKETRAKVIYLEELVNLGDSILTKLRTTGQQPGPVPARPVSLAGLRGSETATVREFQHEGQWLVGRIIVESEDVLSGETEDSRRIFSLDYRVESIKSAEEHGEITVFLCRDGVSIDQQPLLSGRAMFQSLHPGAYEIQLMADNHPVVECVSVVL